MKCIDDSEVYTSAYQIAISMKWRDLTSWLQYNASWYNIFVIVDQALQESKLSQWRYTKENTIQISGVQTTFLDKKIDTF